MQALIPSVNLSEDGLRKSKKSERLRRKEWSNWSKSMRSSTKKVRSFLTRRWKKPKRSQLFPFIDLIQFTQSKLTLKLAKKESKLWKKWRRKKVKWIKTKILKQMLVKMNKIMRKKWQKLSNKLPSNSQTNLTAQRMFNLNQKDKNLQKRTNLSLKMQIKTMNQLLTLFNPSQLNSHPILLSVLSLNLQVSWILLNQTQIIKFSKSCKEISLPNHNNRQQLKLLLSMYSQGKLILRVSKSQFNPSVLSKTRAHLEISHNVPFSLKAIQTSSRKNLLSASKLLNILFSSQIRANKE